MLTVKNPDKIKAILKKESLRNPSSIVRERCQILLTKINNPKMSCQKIANAIGCCRNTVMKAIHTCNEKGIDAVLKIAKKTGRPPKWKEQKESIDATLEKCLPKSLDEAKYILEKIFDIKLCRSAVRYLLRILGKKRRKTKQVPGKADPEKQKEWVNAIQCVIDQAKRGLLKLYFSDAVHFTLGAFNCYVWSKKPVYLPTGAGRDRFNLLGAIDPFTMELIEIHSMTYVNAEQVIRFLEKIRRESGNLPVSLVLDNARYQHCKAVMEKAKELNINLIFLPPYSPNLNIIERLWKYTRKVVLAGKYFPTPDKFHEALRYFFEDDFHNHKSNLESLLTLNFQSFEEVPILYE